MVYSILLLTISICLTPAFGSNNTLLENLFPSVSRTHAMSFSATSVVQAEVSDISLELPSKLRSQEGLVAKVNSVLNIAKRTESEKFYAVRLAVKIIEKDDVKIGPFYTLGVCGLTTFDKTDIIYFLVSAPSEKIEVLANKLLEQCGCLSNYENELRRLWIRCDDPTNTTLNYFQFLDDLRDKMLSDLKPIRRYSEPGKRVGFNLFPTSVARQRTTSDQYSLFDSVRRRFLTNRGIIPPSELALAL